MIKYLVGHVIDVLKTMEPESVHCCVTSPPYWGLRRYSGNQDVVWGGDPKCEHEWGDVLKGPVTAQYDDDGRKKIDSTGTKGVAKRKWTRPRHGCFCQCCDAWLGSLGLEPAPEMYVQHLVEVFREVRRVLRKDGQVWLNMGDSFYGGKGKSNYAFQNRRESPSLHGAHHNITGMGETRPQDLPHDYLKPKDLVGVPWRIAFALQADGWWLRSDIVWMKPNPMTESMKDRPTRNHEYIFLLTKSGKYYYDADAIREPLKDSTKRRDRAPRGRKQNGGGSKISMQGIPYTEELGNMQSNPKGRNKRTVWGTIWEITTQPFPESHFAVYPEALVEPCIKAGTSEKGCCSKCGKPIARVLEKVERPKPQNYGGKWSDQDPNSSGRRILSNLKALRKAGMPHDQPFPVPKTISWEPQCDCEAEAIPCTVLDPFAGAGTTLLVARRLLRDAIGIDISEAYQRMAIRRGGVTVSSLEEFDDPNGKRPTQ